MPIYFSTMVRPPRAYSSQGDLRAATSSSRSLGTARPQPFDPADAGTSEVLHALQPYKQISWEFERKENAGANP
jgi:hypothetical protein